METAILTSKYQNLFPLNYRLHDDYEGLDYSDLASEEEHPFWKTDRVELKTVGIDIGSSTSHLMFSRLVLRRIGVQLSSRFVVVERKVVWKSPILLTPYVNHCQIDAEELSRFVRDSYRQAGPTPEEVDPGAIIITGEALRKENAEAILGMFSAQAGKFVCATAGPNLEAMLAAYGSGGVRESFADGNEKTVMVVDVGGGTTKVAVCRRGVVRETAAVNVGARLLVTDQEGRLIRVEKAAEVLGAELGLDISLGQPLAAAAKQQVSALLADILFNVLERKPLGALAEKLMITPPLTYSEPIDKVIFTGGVAEYVYGCEEGDYGDLGALLGRDIRRHSSLSSFGIPICDADEKIRATVIGASQYTIQVSGNTIFISDESILPLRNIQVISPEMPPEEELSRETIAGAITKTLRHFDIVQGQQRVALALHWDCGPAYPQLRALAEGIKEAFKESIAAGLPLIIVFNTDFGSLLGNILCRELGVQNAIVSIDMVHLNSFDFIDIGEKLPDVGAVPIVVKSLVFLTDREKVFLRRTAEQDMHCITDHDHDHDHDSDHDHKH